MVIFSLGKDWFSILWIEIIWDTETYIFNLCKDENSSNIILLAFLVIQPIHIIQTKALLNSGTVSRRLEENIVTIQMEARLVEKFQGYLCVLKTFYLEKDFSSKARWCFRNTAANLTQQSFWENVDVWTVSW